MSLLVVAYWFAVGFVFIFAISTGVGCTFGFSLRESMAGAFWHALVVSVVATALVIALVFGLRLSGVTP